MAKVIKFPQSEFSIGEMIHHRLFDYRGVIVDVDSKCEATDEWYEQVARSRPPKDQPWYQVLVDGAEHTTYVAEQNLEADQVLSPIDHPLIEVTFAGLENGKYLRKQRIN